MNYYSLTNFILTTQSKKTYNLKHRNQTHQNSNCKHNLALCHAKIFQKGFRIFTRSLRFEIEGFVVINIPPSLDQHFDIFSVHVSFFSSELPWLGSLPLFTSNTYKKDEKFRIKTCM